MIELKNDEEVSGIVVEVDEKMNVILSDCKYSSREGVKTTYEEYSVKGKAIRYVHIPPYIKPKLQINDYIKKTELIKKRNMPGVLKGK